MPEVVAGALADRWGRPVQVYNQGLPHARVEEYLTLVNSHLPDPPPPYVVIGLSGTEVSNAEVAQYASRFLWRGHDFLHGLGSTDWEGFHVEYFEQYLEAPSLIR